MDGSSSENDEDRKYPSSLRVVLKRIARAARDADVDALAKDFLVKLELRSSAKSDTVSSLTARLQCTHLEPKQPFLCPRCQHSFQLRRTRDMHKATCSA
jgi:uncharacterized paraquat-inducible protein A